MATFNGTEFDDDGLTNPIVQGGVEDDVLSGLAGNDVLNGGQGNDTLDGGPGTDTLFGDVGDDELIFKASGDASTFDGGDGIDTFRIIPNIGGTQDLRNATFQDLEIYDGFQQSVIINAGQLDQFDLIRNIGTIFQSNSGRSDLSNSIAPGETGRFQGQGTEQEAFDDYFDITGADTG